jgi:Fe2+ or Zn2+ uptake regulation protein
MDAEHKVGTDAPESHRRFRQALRECGLRVTPARLAFLDALQDAPGPLSPQEIGARLEGSGVNLTTVYRLLDTLTQAGVLVPHLLAPSQVGYELAAPLRRHHHHLICRVCGHLEDLVDCDLTGVLRAAGERRGFRVESHNLEVFGVCAACQRRQGARAGEETSS